jgi:hypothetical protein
MEFRDLNPVELAVPGYSESVVQNHALPNFFRAKSGPTKKQERELNCSFIAHDFEYCYGIFAD